MATILGHTQTNAGGVPFGPAILDGNGNLSSNTVLANGALLSLPLSQLAQLQIPLITFFGGQPTAKGASTGFDNSLVLEGYTDSPLDYLNAFLNTVNGGPFLIEFGGQFFAHSLPWTPPANCSPNNGGLLAFPGAGAEWQSNVITAASWNSSTQQTTYTTAAPHNLGVGATIIINGSSPAKYDVGPVTTLAGTTGNTIVVAATSNPGTYNTTYPGALVNAQLMITNSGVSPVNFKCNQNGNAFWGAIVTATSSIAPQSMSCTSWPSNPGDYNHGGMLISGGKLNGPGPYNLNQYATAGNPKLWSGCGIRMSNCADSKVNNLVANYCGQPIRIDYGTFACTFSNGHPFNGGNGSTIQNPINVYYEGYDCVFEGFEQDSGKFLCIVSSLQNHQSPAGPRLSILGSNWFYNGANAAYSALVVVQSTQANTSLLGLVITGDLYQPASTVPVIACLPFGAQTGTGVSPAVSNNNSFTLTSSTGTPAIGNVVTGYGVPDATFVTNVAGSTITLSNAVTLSNNTALTFNAATGTFASTVPPGWVMSAANPVSSCPGINFRINGVTENFGSNINLLGYFSLYGGIKNIRVTGQGGSLTQPTDSLGKIAVTNVNNPILLSAIALPGTEIEVYCNIAVTTITSAPITANGNNANAGTTTFGSISFASSAAYGGYVLTALSSTTLSVVDPNGVNLGTATVGVAFTSSEINFTASSTTQVTGDVYTIINNYGTAKLNGVTGGSVNLFNNTGEGLALCRCMANSNGTNAFWRVIGDISALAESSITLPGSGSALPSQNAVGNYSIVGGTVTAATIQRGQGTVRTSPFSGGWIPYSPGDSIILTYTGTPVIFFYPE